MTYTNLLIETQNGIATVKVNRPKAMNALNPEVLEDLNQYFLSVRRGAPETKVVILTGEGEKAFVAGADIAAMKDMPPLDAKKFCDLGHETMRQIETCPRPVIAAVNGFCLGGGLELALACDFIYASELARMGLPEVNLGIFPGFGGTQRLARLIGRNRAKELIFTGKMLTAAEAYDWGLVNKVCSPVELLKDAQVVAEEILKKGPLAIEVAKEVVNLGADLGLASGLHLERMAFPYIFSTKDKTEGISAFLEKRKAEFKRN